MRHRKSVSRAALAPGLFEERSSPGANAARLTVIAFCASFLVTKSSAALTFRAKEFFTAALIELKFFWHNKNSSCHDTVSSDEGLAPLGARPGKTSDFKTQTGDSGE
jgi:hypothetical protein